jgi:hypothetical protein
MKNIKNIKYIILVVLVLVLIYILLKYKEKFTISQAEFQTQYQAYITQNKKCDDLITTLQAINTNLAGTTSDLETYLNDNGGGEATSISDKIQAVYDNKTLTIVDSIGVIFNTEDFTTKNTKLKDSLTSLDTEINNTTADIQTAEDSFVTGAIKSIEVKRTDESIEPSGYAVGDTFTVTSETGTEATITLKQDNGMWGANITSEGTNYTIEETLTLVETTDIADGDNSGLTFTVKTLKELDLTTNKIDIDAFEQALNDFKNMEINFQSIDQVNSATTEAAAAAAAAAAATEREKTQFSVTDAGITNKYKVNSFPSDLTKIDRHLVWSNYTIEHDSVEPNTITKGQNHYDMAYDGAIDKGNIYYLKAGSDGSDGSDSNIDNGTKTITFLPNNDVYRHNDLEDNSIILIGSIVLKFDTAITLVDDDTKMPTIKFSASDSAEELDYNTYKIESNKKDSIKKTILFKQPKYIDINKLKGEKKITDVSDFSIIINIANLIPAGSITLEKAHMNYILINHENGNEPSEIIQELIKANYNILNYKTRILVNYLKCDRTNETWKKNGKVCNLMDDTFTPMDLDSRLYGAFKPPLDDDETVKQGAGSTMEINQDIINKIMAYLKTLDGGNSEDSGDSEDTLDTTDLNVIFEGAGHGYKVDAVKAALGYTG